jgi:hypothetical protein
MQRFARSRKYSPRANIFQFYVAPQPLEAGMSIWNLDRGIFKPT